MSGPAGAAARVGQWWQTRRVRHLATQRLGANRAGLGLAGKAGGLLQLVAELVALLVDGGDHGTRRQTEADEGRFRELQARLDGLRDGIGDADGVEVAGMRRVA